MHINTLVIWLLMGFMASIYWFLPGELGRETAGIRVAEMLFYVFCAAVAAVAVVFIFVQYGGSNQAALWFINQGRKYVEAPRWAALGIVVIMVVFAYNVIGTVIAAQKDHRNHHGIDDRSGTVDPALSDRLSGHQQHVCRSVLVVVARSSLGRSDLGGLDRLHHGLGLDAVARHFAQDSGGVALHRSRARPRHRHSRPRSSLFLDRDARLLA